jgi:hypothetical protein
MTTLNIPGSPNLGDTYEENGVIYTWNGEYWTANNAQGFDDRYVNADGDQMTGDLTVPSLNGGPLAGFRNQIINGDFRVWQRGTTSHTTSGYSADRWNSGVLTTTLKNTEQAVCGGDTTDLPESFVHCARTTVTSSLAASSYVTLDQPIEGVRTFAGQQVTLSFYATASAALSISSELIQFFGKDPGVSSPVEAIGVEKHQLEANKWKRFSTTITLPSVAGKVISNSDALKVNFWLDAGSDYNARTDSLGNQSGTFFITGVQLEPGPVATPFEHRPIGTELALCQRYFRTYTATTSPSAGPFNHKVANASNSNGSETSWEAYIGIIGEMRTNVPSVVFGGDTTGLTLRSRSGSAIVAIDSIVCRSFSKGIFTITPASATDPDTKDQIRGNAGTGWLGLDAEL